MIALVANPGSGRGDASQVEDALRDAGAEVETFPPEHAAEATASGPDRLVVAGGDGSIAPAASAAGRAGIPLAMVPVGTANDFAAAAGLPADPGEASRLAVEGEGARPVRCALECDGRGLFEGEAWQAVVGCSGAFGAGSTIGGSPEERQLRVIAVPAGSRLSLLRRAQGLRRGTIGEQTGVVVASCSGVELDLPAGTELNVDGELVESGPVTARIEPAAFELVVP